MAALVLSPVHPGEILKHEFLMPHGMSAGQLARKLHVPRTRIERLVAETAPVTVDTALRLSRFFGTSAEFWLNLQIRYELTLQGAAMRDELAAIPVLDAA